MLALAASLFATKASAMAFSIAVMVILFLSRSALAATGRALLAAWNRNTTPEQRDALYSAIKIGLRVAEARGTTIDGVFKLARGEAVKAVMRYVELWDIPGITEELVTELLDAEAMKVARRDAETAVFAGDSFVPAPPIWRAGDAPKAS